jgi:hypothetical protein
MFVRQNQQQFRNSNADVQIFYGDATSTTASRFKKSWNKPPGVSHVYMMLIGSGATGDGTNGGGSGAVTVWYGAAQNVPDYLEVLCGFNIATTVHYRSGPSLITLLNAATGGNPNGGAVTTAPLFAASGFYQSIAGQDGTSGTQSASATTFLSGGNGGGVPNTANYGYSINSGNGFFMLQPLIVGCGGNDTGNGGIGCGGGLTSSSSRGGQGMVLIASW